MDTHDPAPMLPADIFVESRRQRRDTRPDSIPVDHTKSMQPQVFGEYSVYPLHANPKRMGCAG